MNSREKYIDLMERTLEAYSDEHIQRYFEDVKTNGLSEHGFPRLTSDIGILIAHGRRIDLRPIFLEMMEFCCWNIPRVKAANDFSVREIICCIIEIEKSGAVDPDAILRWKEYLRGIEPEKCYNVFARCVDDRVNNWALFSAVSEFFRISTLGGDTLDFIETQLENQLRRFDENGMYMDELKREDHQPIMYDIVPRGLLAMLLNFGYRGRFYDEIDAIMRKAGLLTLKMQSSNGEMAFGGRSNQFVHNEPWICAIYEYEAARYIREGNTELALKFKEATARALAVTEKWLQKEPIRHIKNRFPTETKYGCEEYAYFDKYMITTASNLHAAYLMCDDSIDALPVCDHEPCIFMTSGHFHKLFAKSSGYSLEFDLNADNRYDAGGLGRVHRDGAPSAICMSLPCPDKPNYTVDTDTPAALSLCPAAWIDDKWHIGADGCVDYNVTETSACEGSAHAAIACRFEDGRTITADYKVSGDGVEIKLKGQGRIAHTLPAFSFDGEKHTDIILSDNALNIRYENWNCRYVTDAHVVDAHRSARNRNGHYETYLADGENEINIKIEISQIG